MDYLNIDKDDYDKLLTSDPRMIQSRIIDFIIYCKDTRQLSPSTVVFDTRNCHFDKVKEIESLYSINSMPAECLRVLAGTMGLQKFFSFIIIVLLMIAMGSVNLRTSSHFE